MHGWLHALVTAFFPRFHFASVVPNLDARKSGIESLLNCNESLKWRRRPAASPRRDPYQL